jgi:uncharacterized membrane protein
MTNTKEVKNYYTDDKLNKGYAKSINKPRDSNPDSPLPPIEVISAYEEIYPGTLEKILKIAEKEQERRFEVEKITASAHERSRRLGALFGVLSIAIISSAAVQISQKDLNTAIIFACIAFASIFGIALLSTIKSGSRPNRFRAENNFNNTQGNYSDKKKFFRRNRRKY